MDSNKSKILSTEPLDASEARWTGLIKTTYIDPNGVKRTWEHARRPTRPAGSKIDGVGIVAILRNRPGQGSDEPTILLQKQFRPPTTRICIEHPAGLIDPNETPEECALRELKEETGYVGEVIGDGAGFVMFNDPGFCDTNLQMVHIQVDMSLPTNQNPTPQLEDNEFIECFEVPLKDLYTECLRLEKEGYGIDARVGTMAEGLELARRWAVFK
ncbi:hypothetical protein P152DRAFT_462339 [Eremomyces bilateralis CBS 781.70]|uniref:Nudix hydrolase domain-containing protein n=1 Tax=Eremomyces bilateralis CBS 781.70 TaxID=1392243 RepID=A0A6G1FS52_9PEZI|nr:uncharacterized protein P152DRAFT_462339 [Eremomyces bilateralis CBS 781.70]KAF1808614.1 hypothetical protein P152DRAFT_462339 [Eremomyces bilateralis CBS 781.70]